MSKAELGKKGVWASLGLSACSSDLQLRLSTFHRLFVGVGQSQTVSSQHRANVSLRGKNTQSTRGYSIVYVHDHCSD